MMKALKSVGFLLLAALVFVGFNYPFFAVPNKFEKETRELTLARIESGSMAVDEAYVNESVKEAMVPRLPGIYRTAFILAAAAAAIVFCISIRPPHDCGGFNLFNPLALIPIAAISVLTGAVISLVLSKVTGQSVSEFRELAAKLTTDFTYGSDKLLLMILVPAALEIVFRGFIFSFLERIHPLIAIVLCPVLYAVTVGSIATGYARWSIGSVEAAKTAMIIALGIGFVHSLLTWRFRSGIPAVLSHILIAYSAGFAVKNAENGSLAFTAALLFLLLAAVMILPSLLGGRIRVLAYDFPFTKHHKSMNKWLFGTKKRRRKHAGKAAAAKPAEKPAEQEPKTKSGKRFGSGVKGKSVKRPHTNRK
ncbi:MAG: CPBP family intramembrane metalloprotease [Clostridiales bacterium]|nr:CPBP family intramembrane metalloprotease [Clostridiales bacterium]